MRRLGFAGFIALSFVCAPLAAADVERGTVQFRPVCDQKTVPESYRLEAHQFDFELEQAKPLPLCKATLYRLRFPSPVVTETPENNTVHAEYYLPEGKGPFPCVIVLDITGGDQSLSRTISMCLAQNRIAALFVQMAYYGPRRPPGSKRRLLSPNVQETLAGVRQTVLDLRRASAWMEGRPELDPKRLGILGTSLGSFVSALTGEMEARLNRVGIMLGGGGFVEAYWEHPLAKPLFKTIGVFGVKKETIQAMIAPADPITCAANLKGRKVLMIAASKDELVPPKAAEQLWKASGEQKIVWYPTTHYGAALYFLQAMDHVVKHFGAE
jgi:dienelactone hydrolase